jgi:hypothetical protein
MLVGCFRVCESEPSVEGFDEGVDFVDAFPRVGLIVYLTKNRVDSVPIGCRLDIRHESEYTGGIPSEQGEEIMGLTRDQYDHLLKPLNGTRIAKRSGGGGKQLSYLEAWDVRAHLIRMFGYGGWSFDVLTADLMYEEKGERNWEVGYKIIGRLTIFGIGPQDQDVTFTEATVGPGNLPNRGDSHDMAIKTAESDCIKRCAVNLGTQFGLSLYDDGATRDVVMKTLIAPPTTGELVADLANPPVKNGDDDDA